MVNNDRFVPHKTYDNSAKPRSMALGGVVVTFVSSLIWMFGCQLPPVIKESVPPIDSPSMGADLSTSQFMDVSAAVISPDTPGLLRSNHKLHVVEQELTCDGCHELGEKLPAMPDHDTCSACHDINLDEPNEDCFMCHVVSAEAVQNKAFDEIEVRPVPEPGGFQFDHTIFGEDTSVCVNCHTKVTESSTSADNLRGDHSTVFPVAKKLGLNTDNCNLCHTNMNKKTPPEFHKKPDFRRVHGKMYGNNPSLCLTCHTEDRCQKCHEQTKPQSHYKPEWRHSHAKVGMFRKDKCMICHSEQACRTCHNSEMPRDHTNFFRRRSHGKIASWNRDRCLVCHKQDYCESCHRGSAPRIPAQVFHNPNAPCLLCHSPSSAVRPLRRHGPLPEASCLNCHQF